MADINDIWKDYIRSEADDRRRAEERGDTSKPGDICANCGHIRWVHMDRIFEGVLEWYCEGGEDEFRRPNGSCQCVEWKPLPGGAPPQEPGNG